MEIRTDLALEAREAVRGQAEEIRGVTLEESYDRELELKVTKVLIETKNGAKIMGKPIGTYITLESPFLCDEEEEHHHKIAGKLAETLRELLPETDEEKSILVVGLGNRDVTADALGPAAVDHLFINRHIILEFGTAAYNRERMNQVSSIVPGVMARTGMESAEIVRGVTMQTNPDLIIAIDALAARSTKRLNRTIQITDTGIHPGSGVGNNRHAMTRESLGVPVIAIGIPTVVDAATIVHDAVKDWNSSTTELRNMYVTGKDIDAVIATLSLTVAEAVNEALNLD